MTDIEKWILDLETRVRRLEEDRKGVPWGGTAAAPVDLVERYGEYVTKTTAAKILGVTRATVYAMIADGRLEGEKRVSVRSIQQFLSQPMKHRSSRMGCRNRRKEEHHGADALEEAR